MARTHNEIDQARTEYAVLTLEELEAKSSGDIRKIAGLVAVGTVDNGDGTMVTYSRAKKAPLVEAIWNVCEDKRRIAQAAEVSKVLTPEQLESFEVVTTEVNEVSRNHDGNLAKDTWLSLRDYINGLWKPETQSWKGTDGGLLNEVSALVNRLRGSTDSLYTVLTRKANVLKAIYELVHLEAQSPYYQQYLEVFNTFKTYTNQALADLTQEKNKMQAVKLKTRTKNVTEVKVKELMAWAVETISTLSAEDDKSKWVNVAIALMLVTGRRQAEVMCSGRFSPATDSTVMFSGQLKTKNRESQPYEIPVLAPVDKVVEAMAWLEAKGKRQSDPKKAHNLYSRYISEGCTKLNRQGLMEVTFVPEGVEPAKLKAHMCRQIYAQIVAKSCPQGMKPKTYIGMILGHGEFDSSTADSYDADIEIVDI